MRGNIIQKRETNVMKRPEEVSNSFTNTTVGSSELLKRNVLADGVSVVTKRPKSRGQLPS